MGINGKSMLANGLVACRGPPAWKCPVHSGSSLLPCAINSNLGCSTPQIVDWWTLEALCNENESESESTMLSSRSLGAIKVAVQELERYYLDWRVASSDPFWHRKSNKAVLSIVVSSHLCPDVDGGWVFKVHRGMNTEVSLPAGSLCAERAAIARVASDFGHASSIAAIAILDPTGKINPLWPCEVCQSWLSKLKGESPNIAVIAVSSVACHRFLVKVNGEFVPPPSVSTVPLPMSSASLADSVVLAEGVTIWPWESKNVVYVDGAWTFLHCGQQNILKAARALGSHLLVGVHSDELLRQIFECTALENFNIRAGRVLQNRYVSFILKDAPWRLTQEMIRSLGIKRVVSGSLSKLEDVGTGTERIDVPEVHDPYEIPRALGMLEIVQSLAHTTERSFHEATLARARL